jgi:hypothetical protein
VPLIPPNLFSLDDSGRRNRNLASWQVFDHDGSCANLAVVANSDVTEDDAVGAQDYVVTDGRVAFDWFVDYSTEGNAVVHHYVVADYRGFADDDTNAVIDNKATADGCARVNFNTSDYLGDVCENSCKRAQLEAPNEVRDSVIPDCVQSGRSEEQFETALGGWVSLNPRFEVFEEVSHVPSLVLFE